MAKRFPKKYHAHILVGNALREGKILKQICEACGEHRVVAHHDNYDKPLEVCWLCQAHHIQWHKENGEGLNGD